MPLKDLNWISTPESSNTNRFAYDKENQALVVDFKRSKMYLYMEVPESVYLALVAAPSKGKFLKEKVIHDYSWMVYTPEPNQDEPVASS